VGRPQNDPQAGSVSSSDLLKTPVWGDLFYPAPVFTRDGDGHSFGKARLLRLEVTLPPA
jgi:hypothetical protein